MADFNFFLNRQGPRGAQGVKGDTGFSPTITPSADNDGLTTYKLVITNENNTYETDNLMGNLNIVDDGGTYLRYDREIGSVRAAEADTATASGAGVIRLSNSTDYENLANDTAMTPSSFVDNYNSLFTNGSGILLSQNADDKIVIAIDDSTIVTEADLTNALANYVTSSNLSSTLADYVTDTELGTALNSYVTNTSLATALSGYVSLHGNQAVGGTKTFFLDQKINGVLIGNQRVSGMNTWLRLQSFTDGDGNLSLDSAVIALGSNSISVEDSYGHSYDLIYTSNGLIPDARLSSNIARTTDIPSIATSVSSSSTNAETVGAKLFYDTCGDIETLINSL